MKRLYLSVFLFFAQSDQLAVFRVPADETIADMDCQLEGYPEYLKVCREAFLEGGRAEAKRRDLAAKRERLEK